jgi:hypothetical protein
LTRERIPGSRTAAWQAPRLTPAATTLTRPDRSISMRKRDGGNGAAHHALRVQSNHRHHTAAAAGDAGSNDDRKRAASPAARFARIGGRRYQELLRVLPGPGESRTMTDLDDRFEGETRAVRHDH